MPVEDMTEIGRKIFISIVCDKLMKFRNAKPEQFVTIQEWAMDEAEKIVEMLCPKQ
jgi:hypothetical protein